MTLIVKFTITFLTVLSVCVLMLAIVVLVLKKEASPVEKLEMFIIEDLELLQEAGSLPKEFYSLAKLEVYGGTEKAKVWTQDLRLPFRLKKDGTHGLEVLIVDWEEGPKEGVIVQYNLNDKASGNMVWELGRTFILKDHSSFYYQIRPHLMNWLRH